jgi:hypothetical protein
MLIGSDSCKVIFKQFGKLIKNNIMAPSLVGVDISREERQGKCMACYKYFVEILGIIERKTSQISSSSSKLLSNFKEINYWMKTIE